MSGAPRSIIPCYASHRCCAMGPKLHFSAEQPQYLREPSLGPGTDSPHSRPALPNVMENRRAGRSYLSRLLSSPRLFPSRLSLLCVRKIALRAWKFGRFATRRHSALLARCLAAPMMKTRCDRSIHGDLQPFCRALPSCEARATSLATARLLLCKQSSELASGEML